MLCVRRCWIVDGAMIDGVRLESGGRFGRRCAFQFLFCVATTRIAARVIFRVRSEVQRMCWKIKKLLSKSIVVVLND
jgi:hypothetical protein